ncbi:universal stress protein [Kineococcus glutinatus]|uniref:UspA domain-containing protein n=1 Tax=Kineococcus glutinatus TaxID=1070872 RepID=A0ABP9I6Q0_9ACTN
MVGYSGSEASRAALHWALREASATGAGVEVVAVDPPNVLAFPRMPGGHLTGPSGSLRAALAQEREQLPGRFPDVFAIVSQGEPAAALLDVAATAPLLVLGAGRRLGAIGFGAGRVLREAVRRCPCPLLVVGPAAEAGPLRQLLVMGDVDAGVGEWAAGYAAAARLRARVVTAWGVDPVLTLDQDTEREFALRDARVRHERTAAALAAVLRHPAPGGLAEGRLRDVLQHRAVPGDLVVVGRVALHDVPVRTLRAPVVVVPPQYQRPGGYRTLTLPADRAELVGPQSS